MRRTIPEGILKASNAELIAVHGRNRERCLKVARRFGVRAAHTLADLLQEDIDAVYIATPNDVHLEQTLAAARAGKHVLCEKPLGVSVAEAKRMVAACRKAGVILGTAFMMRFQSQHRAALKLVREGKLGQPVFARAQLSCWYPPLEGAWRQKARSGGGGALIDLAGHCLDLLEMFFGPVVSVQCQINRAVHSYETEDGAVILARFENGAMATIDTLFCIPDRCSLNRLELYGTKGSILAEGTIGQEAKGKMVAYLEGQQAGYSARQVRADATGIKISPVAMNCYRAEIEAFSKAILKVSDDETSALAGFRSQILIAACYKAARAGKEQRLPSDL